MAITRHFKGSTDSYGYGYFGYIEDGQLVIGENWPREGSVTYRGPYATAGHELAELMTKAPKLYSSITKYYAEEAKKEAKKEAAAKEEDGVRYRFKDSRDLHGNGYSGFIDEDYKLVLEYDDPREGGSYFRGSYDEAVKKGHLHELKFNDPTLYEDIEKYFIKHGTEQNIHIKEKTPSTAGVLWKVKLYMKTELMIHYVLVRGTSESSVIRKLFPKVQEVLTLQTHDARVIAVRSDMISAAEFMSED